MVNYYFQPYKESIPDIPFKSIYSRGNRIFCPRGNFDLVDKEDPDFSWIEMVRENLILDHVLGEGEFGQVFKATLKDEKSENISIVAVKTVKGISLFCYFAVVATFNLGNTGEYVIESRV